MPLWNIKGTAWARVMLKYASKSQQQQKEEEENAEKM